MTEAQNFVEKELNKNSDIPSEEIPSNPIPTPMYTPPVKTEKIPEGTPQPTIQIVEKIVYKRPRFHGFFRTLTLLALLVIGFLMLGEAT